MQNGVSVVYVVPILIVIALIARNAKSKVVICAALAFVAAVTLFCALASAGEGNYAALLAVAALATGALVALIRIRRNNQKG